MILNHLCFEPKLLKLRRVYLVRAAQFWEKYESFSSSLAQFFEEAKKH